MRLQFDGHERGYVEPKFNKKYLIQAFTDSKVYLGVVSVIMFYIYKML